MVSENKRVIEFDIVLEPRRTRGGCRGSAIFFGNNLVESSWSILTSILAANGKESDDVRACDDCSRYDSTSNGLQRYWAVVLLRKSVWFYAGDATLRTLAKMKALSRTEPMMV